jgi:hypothetical protein
MIVFKNGREADRIVGYHPKPQLMQKLTPHLAAAAAAMPATPAPPTSVSPNGPSASPNGPTASAPTPPSAGSPTSSTPNAGVGVNKIH